MNIPHSPCIAVCVMDTQLEWCKGCYRTLDEIASWSNLDDEKKHQILLKLVDRKNRQK